MLPHFNIAIVCSLSTQAPIVEVADNALIMLRLPSIIIKVSLVQVQSYAWNYSHDNMFIDSRWWIWAGGCSWACSIGSFLLRWAVKKEHYTEKHHNIFIFDDKKVN